MASTSSSSSGGQPRWVTWAIVGTTASVAVAGLGYLAWSAWREEESSKKKGQLDDAAMRLRVARGLQMQALAPGAGTTGLRPKPPAGAGPSLPVRSTPKQPGASSNGTSKAAAAGPSAGPGAGGASRKLCAQCSKATTGLPLRCSGCKQVYYCSQDCQRKAWPTHKASCKQPAAAGSAPSPTSPPQASGPAAASPSTSATSKPAPTDEPAASTSSPSPASAAAPAEEPRTLQEALAQYLEQNAAAKTDQLEASFEMAVMLFVKAEYRAAITQLQRVKEMAAERGDKGVVGETYKWLGHAHNRLAATQEAQRTFEQGAAYAKQHGLQRLEIDCLGGLGCLYRAQGDADKAVSLLEEALALSQASKDDDSRASTMCNLGSALIKSDPDKALRYLHEAVTLRELAIERLHDAGERSGLATAVMEHANALCNLASALLVTKRLNEAEACYVRALEVFELVEDVDKVVKTLVNLANLKELHARGKHEARQQALAYRQRLLDFMQSHGVRRFETACSICLSPLDMREVTQDEDKELILLSCLHCLHNKCWEGWAEKHSGDVTCPTCKQPVPLFDA